MLTEGKWVQVYRSITKDTNPFVHTGQHYQKEDGPDNAWHQRMSVPVVKSCIYHNSGQFDLKYVSLATCNMAIA